MSRFILVSVLVVGCSYPEFEFVDAGARGDVAIQDTAVSDTTESDTSSAIDSFVADTYVADTNVADTSADVTSETPMPTGCAGSTAAFCADFDMSTLPQDGWNGRSLSSSSELLLETTGAHSAPKLMVARVQAAPTTTTSALVNAVVAPTTIDREARIDVWVKLPTTAFAGKSIYLFKYLRAGAGDGLAFSMDATGYYLEVNAPGGGNRRIARAVDTGTWVHVRMDAKLQYVGGSATVWIDDMTTPALSLSGIPTLETDSLDRRLSVGVYAQNPTASYEARFDDVSVGWK